MSIPWFIGVLIIPGRILSIYSSSFWGSSEKLCKMKENNEKRWLLGEACLALWGTGGNKRPVAVHGSSQRGNVERVFLNYLQRQSYSETFEKLLGKSNQRICDWFLCCTFLRLMKDLNLPDFKKNMQSHILLVSRTSNRWGSLFSAYSVVQWLLLSFLG